MCRAILHMNGAISLGQAFLLYTTSTLQQTSKSSLIAISLLPRLGVSLFYGWKSSGEYLGIAMALAIFGTNQFILEGVSLIMLFRVFLLVCFGTSMAQQIFLVDIDRPGR